MGDILSPDLLQYGPTLFLAVLMFVAYQKLVERIQTDNAEREKVLHDLIKANTAALTSVAAVQDNTCNKLEDVEDALAEALKSLARIENKPPARTRRTA